MLSSRMLGHRKTGGHGLCSSKCGMCCVFAPSPTSQKILSVCSHLLYSEFNLLALDSSSTCVSVDVLCKELAFLSLCHFAKDGSDTRR